MSEEEALQLRKTVTDLVNSHNGVIQSLDSFQKLDVPEKAIEAHYMLSTIIELLVKKGIFTAEDVKAVAERVQLTDLGWTAKPEPAVAELGDIIRIKFQLFDGDRMVDDQSGEPFAYTMGSNNLSCEKDFLGMKVGEQRTCSVVFGDGFKLKEYIGRELKMVVLCSGIMQSKDAAKQTVEAPAKKKFWRFWR